MEKTIKLLDKRIDTLITVINKYKSVNKPTNINSAREQYLSHIINNKEKDDLFDILIDMKLAVAGVNILIHELQNEIMYP